MKYKKMIFLFFFLVSYSITSLASEKEKMSLTKERLSGIGIQPSLGLKNIFLEGTISLVEKNERRIVIRDQSILVKSQTSFTRENSSVPLSFQDLKIGSEIRVGVAYEKGELTASSIHQFNEQKKTKQRNDNKKERSTMLLD